MAEFTLNGVTLQIPDALMTGQLDQSMQAGRYEHTEADAVLRHLRPRDRFLDLGAGAGYLTALAGAIKAVAAANGVEAGPEMAKVAQANLARNGVVGEIVWGAVVPDGFGADSVTFTLRRSFWASSLTPPPDARNTRVVEVPALRIGALLARFVPSVVSIDIEGGELELFDAGLPDTLRLLVLELHPSVYGAAGIGRIFDRLAAAGFSYCPAGSQSGVVVFQRIR